MENLSSDSSPTPPENISKLQEELRRLLNSLSIENGSDTPDYVLAEYLISCLQAYEKAIAAREAWFSGDE
jgi:hypothetical protein